MVGWKVGDLHPPHRREFQPRRGFADRLGSVDGAACMRHSRDVMSKKGNRVEAIQKRWLSQSEAMQYLGKTRGFFDNLRNNALLPYYQVGKSIFYDIRDIDKLITKNKVI